jgi:hypothetical protein
MAVATTRLDEITDVNNIILKPSLDHRVTSRHCADEYDLACGDKRRGKHIYEHSPRAGRVT